MAGEQYPHSLQAHRRAPAGGARDRVVLRFYGGDGRRYAYLAVDLTRQGYYQVHPVCHPLLGYRLGHVTGLIGFRDLGNRFETCDPCAMWLQDHPHEIFTDNEIVAVHGILDIPEEFRRRERVADAIEARAALAA